MIEQIRQVAVTSVLLTGDNENAARHIASKLSITEIRYECRQKNKQQICMIGVG